MNARPSSLLRRTLLAVLCATSSAYAINHNPSSGNGDTGYPATLSLSSPSATMGENGKVTVTVNLDLEGDDGALTAQSVNIIGIKPGVDGGADEEFEIATNVSSTGPQSKELDPTDCGCNFTLKITNLTEGNGETSPTDPVEVDADGGNEEPSNGASSTEGGGGPAMDMGMGQGSGGASSAGSLQFNFTQPDAKMYSPEGLKERISSQGTSVARFDGPDSAVRQVIAPNQVTDIKVVSPSEYTVTAYRPSDIQSMEGDLFVVDEENTTPLRKVTVKNPGAAQIQGTSDEGLYHEVRWGKDFKYDIPVPKGRYEVALDFVEFHKDTAGANTFDVIAEGVTKLPALDVRAEAGARYTALTKSIATQVDDGSLALQFKAISGGAHVAALKVIKAEIPVIANTSDADLYQTARTGDFSYNLSLPNADYEVALHFIEPLHDAAAGRIFDVMVEGVPALADYDIRDEAGAIDQAHIELIPVTLTDGQLDVDFLSDTDVARLSALVVRDVATDTIIAAINVGGPAYVAVDTTSFVADQDFTGGSVDAPGQLVVAINAGGSAFEAGDSTDYAGDDHFSNGKSFAGAYNGLQITTQNGSEAAKEYDYTWIANPETGKFDELILTYAGGLKREGRIQTWSADGLSYDETITLYGPDNQADSKVVTTYEKFPFGLRKVREVRDPDGSAPVVTTWSYVEGSGNPDGPKPSGYGRVKRIVDPMKGWTDYTYDDENDVYTKTQGGLNATPGTVTGARVETTTYSTGTPRITSIVTIDGQEVSRSWTHEVVSGATRTEERQVATVPGAAWDDSTNLVSITQSYTSDETDPLKRNQPAWSQAPNGTRTRYAYTASGTDRIVTREAGAYNASTDDIEAGTLTITRTNDRGHQEEEEIKDIASGLTLSHWEAVTTDGLGRPTLIDYEDGTTRSITYVGSSASCGSCSSAGTYLIESETDRNGVITHYGYDALNRRTHITRLGVIEEIHYDASDRITERHRIAMDGPVVDNSSTEGTRFRIEKNTYDLAGRLQSTADQVATVVYDEYDQLETLDPVPTGNVTTYAYEYPVGGGMVTTMTNPATVAGSGTRIETIYADGRMKEVSGTAVSPMKYAYGTWAAAGQAGEWTQEIKVGEGGSETEWTKTYADLARRTVRMEYPDAAEATMTYNVLGQLFSQTDPDGVTTLYAYNAEGQREVTAVNMADPDPLNPSIDYAGLDRITKVTRDVYSRSGTTVHRTTTQVWAADNTDTATTVSITELDGYGNQSWLTDAVGAESSTVLARTGAGTWTVTSTAPDDSHQVQTYAGGLLVSTIRKNSSGGQITKTDYAYDAHNRVETQTDARTGDTDYTYTDRDEVLSVTTNNGTETTVYAYDALGNRLTITRPDSSVTANEYHLRNNQLKKVSGSLTYPVEYTYDPQGRMKTLTTWQNAATSAGAAVTTWSYDSQRGWLSEKLYDDGKGPVYTYTDAGRLETRTWARTVSSAALVTTYAYNNAGDLTSTDYSDTTPDVAITYKRFGAQHTVTDAAGTRTFTYNAALRPDQEQLDATYYGSRILTRLYDVGLDLASTPSSVPGRSSGFKLGTAATPDADTAVSYTYDTAGRLGTVTGQSGSYTYDYLANSNLLAEVDGPVHDVFKTYEPYRDVIDIMENKVGTTSISKYDYTVNSLGQRTQRVNTGTAFGTASTDDFSYNAKGEVTGSTNATIPAYERTFVYDDIGNRKSSSAGILPAVSYTANELNQYTAIGAVSPTYDLDGNQLTTGTGHIYKWDAENRLISVEPALPLTSDKKQVNTYDGQSRRVRKQVYTYTGSVWSPTIDEKFIYDGWNVVAVLNAASSNALLRTYTWGMDLSGSLQGAGGVGGLLATSEISGGTISATYHYTYDANGNVSEVLDNSGGIAAHYEYDAFGNTVSSSGTYAATNAYRFSTKPQDSVSELYYYGYRYYNPSTGRWLSRDPIEQIKGDKPELLPEGPNIYAYVGNSPLGRWDLLGLNLDGQKCAVAAEVVAASCTIWCAKLSCWPFGSKACECRYVCVPGLLQWMRAGLIAGSCGPCR